MSTNALQPGTTFKTRVYRIESVLHQDGISITYLARFLQNQVIIKEFFPQGSIRSLDQSVEPQSLTKEQYVVFKNQYLEEADAISQYKQHPNLLHITDVFQENNTTYYVQPYLEGKNLDEYCKAKGGKLSVEESEPIIQQISEAITALHAQKIVHGDIQPENVFITRAGNAILTGLAPRRDAVLKEILQYSLIHAPGYSPLEMFDYEANRGSYSDVYSFAATIYRMLGGQRPVPAETRQIRKLVPLGNYNSGIPKAIEGAVHKGMALHPQERFATIAEFLRALDMTQRGEATTAFPKSEEAEIRFDALVTEGDRLFLNGEFVRAKRNYEEARQIHPDDNYLRGRISECNRRLQEESATPVTAAPIATSPTTKNTAVTPTNETKLKDVSIAGGATTGAVARIEEEEEEKEKKGAFWWWLPLLLFGVLLLWMSGIFGGGDKTVDKKKDRMANTTPRLEPVVPSNNNQPDRRVNASDTIKSGGVSSADNAPWNPNNTENPDENTAVNNNNNGDVPVTNSREDDPGETTTGTTNNEGTTTEPTSPPPTPVPTAEKPTNTTTNTPTPANTPTPPPSKPTPPPAQPVTSSSKVKVVKHKPGNIKSSSLSRGYYVIVGAFKDKGNAERIAGQLKGDGHNAKLIPLANGYYRVGVPAGGGKEGAKRLATQCQGYNKDAWVLDYN